MVRRRKARADLLDALRGHDDPTLRALADHLGFTGQRADAATGLLYYGARYYDALAGQFTSGDSVLSGSGFDLWGLSRYAYVEGNPIGRTDPTGHCSADCWEDDPTDTSMDPPAPDPCADGACDPSLDYTSLDPGYDMGTPPPPPPDPCYSCADPGYDQGDPPPADTQPPTVQSFVPHMIGLGYSVQLEAGRGPEAGGGTAALDYFAPMPWEGPSYDVLSFTAGGFARNDSALQIGPFSIPAFSAGYPQQDRGEVLGLYGGGGPHILLSNAQGPDDLRGRFTQYSINFGYVDTLGAQLSLGTNAKGQPIYVASLAPRFLPLGAGISIAGSRYATTTKILWSALSGGLIENAS